MCLKYCWLSVKNRVDPDQTPCILFTQTCLSKKIEVQTETLLHQINESLRHPVTRLPISIIYNRMSLWRLIWFYTVYLDLSVPTLRLTATLPNKINYSLRKSVTGRLISLIHNRMILWRLVWFYTVYPDVLVSSKTLLNTVPLLHQSNDSLRQSVTCLPISLIYNGIIL